MGSDNKVIAFYIGSLARGGAERVMVNLASYFKEQNYTVYLVTKMVDEPEYDVPDGVTRIIADITKDEETSSRIGNLKRRIQKLKNIWSDIKPDIIVSFIRKNNLMAIASAKGLGIPVVVSIRSNPARELQGKMIKPVSFFMFRFAKGIVMQTTQAKAYLPKYLQKKAVIMPNSLSVQFAQMEPATDRKNEIVTVGRIDNNKNQKMLIEVFHEIEEDYPSWSLHLYGDGEKKKGLEQEYASDRIVFHGQVPDVINYIKDSSVFVLPSRQEGMPNALIEAMALGMAVISTDCPCGGPADLIEQDVNGILIPVDDAKQLKKEMIRVIEAKELRDEMGGNAHKIIDILHPDVVNGMWKEYIESLI